MNIYKTTQHCLSENSGINSKISYWHQGYYFTSMTRSTQVHTLPEQGERGGGGGGKVLTKVSRGAKDSITSFQLFSLLIIACSQEYVLVTLFSRHAYTLGKGKCIIQDQHTVVISSSQSNCDKNNIATNNWYGGPCNTICSIWKDHQLQPHHN